jgi:putative ABC transport system permease protein
VVDLVAELRHALRRAVRRPGFNASIVLILALGIGISTAVESVVRRVLVRPIPVAELRRLVVAWQTEPSQMGAILEVSYPYFLDWRLANRSFEDLAAFGSVNWTLELKGAPRRETVASSAVSASFFDTLRAKPLLGRTFKAREDEPGSERVLVLSYALWQRRFVGDPAVVGRTVAGGSGPFTIVGVMPKDFDFPRGAQVWTPLAAELEGARRSMTPAAFRGFGVLYVLGRLRPGVSREAARADLAGISHRLSLSDGMSATGWDARLEPLVDHYLGASTRRGLEALAVASGLVLLLACANVTVMLLVEATGRRTELAVRRALGAGAVRAALPEIALVLALVFTAGLVGAALARWAVQIAVALGSAAMPGLRDASVNAGALAFTFLLTLGVGALVTLAPVAIASRLAIVPALKSGCRGGGSDRRGTGLKHLLVASEVALAVVLLVGSGLMVKSLGKLLRLELGFVPDHTLSFSVDLVPEKYPTLAERRRLVRALTLGLERVPGVTAAGAVYLRPLEAGPIGMDSGVVPEGSPLDLPSIQRNAIFVNWEVATPDYFRAVGTRLLEGRTFTEHDTEETPKVVVVSQSLARRCWPGQNALGKRLNTHGAQAGFKDGRLVDVEWQTVVGVAEDARYRGIQNPRPDVYLAQSQAPESAQFFVVRTTGSPEDVSAAVRAEVRASDPDAEVTNLTTMTALVERALLPWRFTSTLLGAFALAGIVLTASGLFAALHQLVASRTREIGLRMALGASPRTVRAFVLAEGMRVTLMGLVPGLGLSFVLASALRELLYGVGAHDPASYFGAAAVVTFVAILACLLPARRAAGVDPAKALRSE